jgi:hypothetical protein
VEPLKATVKALKRALAQVQCDLTNEHDECARRVDAQIWHLDQAHDQNRKLCQKLSRSNACSN